MNTKINFYHLTKTPLEKALPKLLEKVLASGDRTVVKANDNDRVEKLNKDLWTYTTKFFLPHGSKNDSNHSRQPIYLTDEDENPNGSKVLAVVDNAEASEIKNFDKCLYIFNGLETEQVSKARNRWKIYKDEGFELVYWKQNEKGGWQQGS